MVSVGQPPLGLKLLEKREHTCMCVFTALCSGVFVQCVFVLCVYCVFVILLCVRVDMHAAVHINYASRV